MGSKYTHVFEPFTIRGVTFKNRIINSPGVPGLASNDGCSTPQLRDYHAAYARGGAAVVTIGNASIDGQNYRDESRQIDLTNPRTWISLNELVEGIERYGAVANIEINHPGMHVPNDPDRVKKPPIGPSKCINAHGVEVVEMDHEMIAQVQDAFAAAALNLKKAGFRMIMIHGAHGNLLPQFVSPFTNHRTDEYGGSLENRARFVIETLDKVRAAVGDDMVIEYRIAAEEYAENGMHIKDTIEFVKMIEDKIDLLHVSSGMVHVLEYVRFMIAPTYEEHCINVKYARALKQAGIKVPLSVVGSIMNIENAEKILAAGDADMVAMFRPFMADPNLVKKCARNHPEDVAPCMRCSYHGRIIKNQVVGCAVNPMQGRESEFPGGLVPQTRVKKKVAVIGGGPGGMQAARTATEAGHEVVLFEKAGRLGGNMIPAGWLEMKVDLHNYYAYAVRQTEKCGCEIRLNTTATPEMIEAEGFDAVIVAIGADHTFPPIPGIERAAWSPDADMGNVEVGQDVVIIGGGQVGYETAIDQGRKGKNVTIVDILPLDKLPTGAGIRNVSSAAISIVNHAQAAGVRECAEVKIREITTDSVIVEHADGSVETIKADTVLVAAGMKPRKAEAETFRHVIAETDVYYVGDVVAPRNIGFAVNEGFNAALALNE